MEAFAPSKFFLGYNSSTGVSVYRAVLIESTCITFWALMLYCIVETGNVTTNIWKYLNYPGLAYYCLVLLDLIWLVVHSKIMFIDLISCAMAICFYAVIVANQEKAIDMFWVVAAVKLPVDFVVFLIKT